MPSAAQLTLTACVVGIAVGQILLGPVSDRVGRRLPLLVGLAAFVVSSLACALARSSARSRRDVPGRRMSGRCVESSDGAKRRRERRAIAARG